MATNSGEADCPRCGYDRMSFCADTSSKNQIEECPFCGWHSYSDWRRTGSFHECMGVVLPDWEMVPGSEVITQLSLDDINELRQDMNDRDEGENLLYLTKVPDEGWRSSATCYVQERKSQTPAGHVDLVPNDPPELKTTTFEGVIEVGCHRVGFWYDRCGVELTEELKEVLEEEVEERVKTCIPKGYRQGELFWEKDGVWQMGWWEIVK